MACALAQYTKGNSHIVLCGRNQEAGESTIKSFPKVDHQSTDAGMQHEVVRCDATLMRNVEATTSLLLSRLPKLNYLVLSSGFFNLRGRDETSEGIDKRLALNYYARWKFIHDLIPLLEKARDAQEDVKVMTVLAPGTGGKINLDDLGLKKSYNIAKAYLAVPTYNDLMIEAFAERNPGMSFTHIFPGIVRTPMLWSMLHYLMYPITTAPEDCAEHLLYALLNGSAGASRRNNKGDDIGKTRYYGSDEARERLWNHTVEEINRAKSTGA